MKIAAMGLAAATITLAILDAAGARASAIILAIGLFVLAVGSVMHQQRPMGSAGRRSGITGATVPHGIEGLRPHRSTLSMSSPTDHPRSPA